MKNSAKKLLALTLAFALALALAPGAFADVTAGTHDLTHITIEPLSEILPGAEGDPYTVTLVADTGYTLPASVSVTVEGQPVIPILDESRGIVVPTTVENGSLTPSRYHRAGVPA